MGNILSSDNQTYGDRFRNDYPDGSYIVGYQKWFSIVLSKKFSKDGILLEEHDNIHSIRRKYNSQGILVEEVTPQCTYVYNDAGILIKRTTPASEVLYRPDGSSIVETPDRYREYDSSGTLTKERIYDAHGCIGQIIEKGRVLYDSNLARDISLDYLARKTMKEISS